MVETMNPIRLKFTKIKTCCDGDFNGANIEVLAGLLTLLYNVETS